jgi:hypothetical protein
LLLLPSLCLAACDILTGGEESPVTIRPAAATVARGGIQPFTATIAGTGAPDQAVTWSVEGMAVTATTITTGGVLVVAPGETAPSVIVRATSATDATKSGTAIVTVSPGPSVYNAAIPRRLRR